MMRRTCARARVPALVLCVLVLAASAVAQAQQALPDREAAPGAPGWTADANGCRVWNPYPQPNETFTWSGPCVKGMVHGRGVVAWFANGQPGSRITGDYREGRLAGRVVVESTDGRRYEGGWRDDRRNGSGVQTWPSGDRYDGNWTNDLPDGQGTLTFANGKSVSGAWRAGCLRAGDRVYGAGREASECQ